MQKQLTFFSKNISMSTIFNDKSFNGRLANNIVSFEQLGSGLGLLLVTFCQFLTELSTDDMIMAGFYHPTFY